MEDLTIISTLFVWRRGETNHPDRVKSTLIAKARGPSRRLDGSTTAGVDITGAEAELDGRLNFMAKSTKFVESGRGSAVG